MTRAKQALEPTAASKFSDGLWSVISLLERIALTAFYAAAAYALGKAAAGIEFWIESTTLMINLSLKAMGAQ